MSCYFECESGTLWNPGNSAARLFIGFCRALEDVLGVSSGVGDVADDESWVDVGQLGVFSVKAYQLIGQGEGSVLSALAWECLAVCSALLERAGADLSPLLAWQGDALSRWARAKESAGARMPR